jgi:hypothetical protein
MGTGGAAHYTKGLVTGLGMIMFRVERVDRRTDGRVYSPILEALDGKQRKYSRDVRMKCVEFASKMSYGDASTELETAKGIHVPKRTIYSFLQQIAPRLLELNRALGFFIPIVLDVARKRSL